MRHALEPAAGRGPMAGTEAAEAPGNHVAAGLSAPAPAWDSRVASLAGRDSPGGIPAGDTLAVGSPGEACIRADIQACPEAGNQAPLGVGIRADSPAAVGRSPEDSLAA